MLCVRTRTVRTYVWGARPPRRSGSVHNGTHSLQVLALQSPMPRMHKVRARAGVWSRKLSSRKQTTAAYLMTQHTAWAPHVTSTRTTGRRLDCYSHARDELYIRANSVEASTSTHEA